MSRTLRRPAPPPSKPGLEPRQRPAWLISPHSSGAPDVGALEVAHDSDPGDRGLSEPHAPFVPASWPSPDASLLPLLRPTPEPSPFPEKARPVPEAGPFPETDPFPELGPVPEPGAGHGPEPATSPEPGAGTGPAASTETGAPPHSESASGPARRLRSGLVAAGLAGCPVVPLAPLLLLRQRRPRRTRLAPRKHSPRLRCPRRRPSPWRAGCSVFSPVPPSLPHWTSPGRPSRYLPRRCHRHPPSRHRCRSRPLRCPPIPKSLPQPLSPRPRHRAVHARPVGCCALASRVSAADAGIRTRAARFTRSGRRRARGLRCARPRDWHPRDWHP